MLRRFVTGISDYIYLVMSGPIQVDVDEEDNGWNLDGTPMNQSMRSDTPPSSPRTGPPITSPPVKTAPTSNETPVEAFDEASSAPSRETPVMVSSSRGRSMPRSDSGHIPVTPPTSPSSGSMSSYAGSPPTPPPRGIDIPVSYTPATSSDSASNTIRPDGRRFEAFDTTLDNCTTSVKCTDPSRTSSQCYPMAIPSPRASQQAVMTPDQAHREINSIQQSAQMLNAALYRGDFEQCPDSLFTIRNEIPAAISELETFFHGSQVSSAECSRSPLHRHNTYPRMNAETTRGLPGTAGCLSPPGTQCARCDVHAQLGVTNRPCRLARISRQTLVRNVPSDIYETIRLGLEDRDNAWKAIAEPRLSTNLIRDIDNKGERSGMENTHLKMLLARREMDNYKMADLIADLEDIRKESLIEQLEPHLE